MFNIYLNTLNNRERKRQVVDVSVAVVKGLDDCDGDDCVVSCFKILILAKNTFNNKG